MNFRELIEKAMHEASDEFADLVAEKLERLMGRSGESGTSRGRTSARPRSTEKRGARAVKVASKRGTGDALA